MELSAAFKEEFDSKLNQLKRFTNHGPSLGRYVELLLLTLFRKYFPSKYSFNSGFIYSLDPVTENPASSQLDIICYDRREYPIFFDEDEIVVVSPKSVKGIVEVKTTLTSEALRQILHTIKLQPFKEVSNNSKAFLVATKSSISSRTAYQKLKKHFEGKTGEVEENMFLGAIFCLDWNEMITFRTDKNGDDIEYSCARIEIYDYGLSSFIGNLLYEIYGADVLRSISNVLSPSLYKVIDSFSIKMSFKRPN